MNPVELWDQLSERKFFGITLADAAGRTAFLLVVIIAACIVERILTRMVRHALNAAKVPSASFLVNAVRGGVWSFALMLVLEPVFGVQPTAFIAALGIGSVALSLGMQDTVSNIVGGLSLMVTKVIEVGDTIKVADFTGRVVDINWRSTCLRDSYGQINVIPNSVLSKTALVKLSDYTKSRCQISIVIKHGSDLNDVIADIARAARDVLGSRVDPALGVDVLISGFDAAGIQAVANVHLVPGTNFDEARTMLASHLIGRPWVSCAF